MPATLRRRFQRVVPVALQRSTLAFVFSTLVVIPSVALAGELKFGDAAVGGLDVNDSGQITSKGRKSATTTLDHVPGEDAWELDVWAKIDRGRPGELYVEFFHKVGKKESIVYRHIVEDYEGEKLVHWQIRLEGNVGFNKNTNYRVALTQELDNGKELKHGQSRIKLVKNRESLPNEGGNSEGDHPDDGNGEDREAGDGEPNEQVDQDALDTLSGPDEDPEANPPPIDPAAKGGCSLGGQSGGLPFAAALMGLAIPAFRRRRRQ